MENQVLDRLSSLSIIVDDVDAKGLNSSKDKNEVTSKDEGAQERIRFSPEIQKQIQWTQNPYPKHVLMAASAKIMNDAARRKKNFSKLIDEHEALVKYVAKMEEENSSLSSICKMTQSTIVT
nr:uncharacterized protein LOC111501798 isoform X1 [Leptinotarsa decemlineata]